jgi:hypothetical protein
MPISTQCVLAHSQRMCHTCVSGYGDVVACCCLFVAPQYFGATSLCKATFPSTLQSGFLLLYMCHVTSHNPSSCIPFLPMWVSHFMLVTYMPSCGGMSGHRLILYCWGMGMNSMLGTHSMNYGRGLGVLCKCEGWAVISPRVQTVVFIQNVSCLHHSS